MLRRTAQHGKRINLAIGTKRCVPLNCNMCVKMNAITNNCMLANDTIRAYFYISTNLRRW
jgi:hypothetical protein